MIKRYSILVLALGAVGAYGQTAPIAAEPFPNDFRGLVIYDGAMGGTVTIPPQGQMELSLGGLLNQALNTRTVNVRGSYHVEVEFDNSRIRGRVIVNSDTQGVGNNTTFMGTRSADRCSLIFNNGDRVDVNCNRSFFGAVQKYTNDAGQRVNLKFEATTTSVTDYLERDRRQALADSSKASRTSSPSQSESNVEEAGFIDADTSTKVNALGGIKSVIVKMDSIDDLAMFLVIDAKGNPHQAVAAEWTAQGGAGSGSASINKYLLPGRNGLIFLLHNKAFAFGPGKWTFSASVTGDGREIWSASGGERGGGVGVRYWKAFYIDKSKAGLLSIVPSSPSSLARLKPGIERINTKLVTEQGSETSSSGMLVGALAAGMTDSIMSGSGDAGCGASCREEQWHQSQEDWERSREKYQPK